MKLIRKVETEAQRTYWAFIDSVVAGYKRGKCPQCGNDSRPTPTNLPQEGQEKEKE